MMVPATGEYYVYLYRDPREWKGGQPIYVGKGAKGSGRHRDHLSRPANVMLGRKIASIRRSGFDPTIEIVAWFETEREAFEAERALIAQIGRSDIGSGPLCNMTDGGEGAKGAIRSAVVRSKLRGLWSERGGDVIAANVAAWSDPQRRDARRASLSAALNRPEVKERHRASRPTLASMPDFGLRISEGLKVALSRPEAVKAKSKASRKNWQNPEFKAKTREAISKGKQKWWIYADGRRYASAREAAAALGVTPDCVTLRCRKGIYRRELKAKD